MGQAIGYKVHAPILRMSLYSTMAVALALVLSSFLAFPASSCPSDGNLAAPAKLQVAVEAKASPILVLVDQQGLAASGVDSVRPRFPTSGGQGHVASTASMVSVAGMGAACHEGCNSAACCGSVFCGSAPGYAVVGGPDLGPLVAGRETRDLPCDQRAGGRLGARSANKASPKPDLSAASRRHPSSTRAPSRGPVTRASQIAVTDPLSVDVREAMSIEVWQPLMRLSCKAEPVTGWESESRC